MVEPISRFLRLVLLQVDDDKLSPLLQFTGSFLGFGINGLIWLLIYKRAVRGREWDRTLIIPSSFSLGRAIIKLMGYGMLVTLLAAIGICFLWGQDFPFESLSQKIESSAMMATGWVSGSGVNGLDKTRLACFSEHAYILKLFLSVLGMFGMLGIFAIADIFSLKRMRLRMSDPQNYSWHPETIRTIWGIGLLMILGSGLLLLTIKNQIHLKTVEAGIQSIFHTVNLWTGNPDNLLKSFDQLPAIYLGILFINTIGGGLGNAYQGIPITLFFQKSRNYRRIFIWLLKASAIMIVILSPFLLNHYLWEFPSGQYENAISVSLKILNYYFGAKYLKMVYTSEPMPELLVGEEEVPIEV